MKTALLICTLAAALLLAPRSAHAYTYTGYACSVYVSPTATTYGDSGFVQVMLYSGPSCTGSYVAGPVLCSANATACNGYSLTNSLFAAIVQALQQSVLAVNQKVKFEANATSIAYGVYFYPAGY